MVVSSNIIKIFIEWDWVKVVGYKEVFGWLVFYVIIKGFLDYFLMMLLSDLFNVDVFENMVESVVLDLLFKVLNEVLFE